LKPLPPGSEIDTKLKDGRALRGRLVSLNPDGFTLAVSQRGTETNRTIKFSEVESVQPRKHASTIAWIAAGAIIAVVVIVVSIVLIERHNEGA
jgi:hypothetical protein